MNLAGWLKLVEEVAPKVLEFTPLAPIAPYVQFGVQAAEQFPGATGKQKLDIAKAITHVGVAAANAQAGKEIINPVILDQVVTDGINSVVGAVNLKQGAANVPAKA